MPKRVLLIASTTGYQVRVFADAARRMGLDLVLATDRCHVLENPWGDDAIPLSSGIESLAKHGPFDGIVAVGDQSSFVASQAAERLGLRFSSPDSVEASKNKSLARERFRAAGLLTPEYRLDSEPDQYPCVLKPLSLSGSRGVIRANTAAEFAEAYARIKKMVEKDAHLVVEDFIPGREFALEGLVTDGRLQVLALFDKPDPLDGPYFEETIYVTPSREPIALQQEIFATAQAAVTALGLTHGPVHAEMRVNQRGVWMLEVAARPIGGLCSRALRFESDVALEEVILRHALGEDMRGVQLAAGAHGVMMIPIPRAGVYRGVEGEGSARAVSGIEDIVISAKEGQAMIPLPEGASYLGFIFARAASAGAVEDALRQSHAQLRFQLSATLPVVR
jgi:predicted ATP-grasp superfamily ATP-dependent carboligase